MTGPFMHVHAGFLPTLIAICTDTAALITQYVQDYTTINSSSRGSKPGLLNSKAAGAAASLGTSLLSLWALLRMLWANDSLKSELPLGPFPDLEVIYNPDFAPTNVPICKVANALLRYWGSCSSNSSNSGSASSSKAAEENVLVLAHVTPMSLSTAINHIIIKGAY